MLTRQQRLSITNSKEFTRTCLKARTRFEYCEVRPMSETYYFQTYEQGRWREGTYYLEESWGLIFEKLKKYFKMFKVLFLNIFRNSAKRKCQRLKKI